VKERKTEQKAETMKKQINHNCTWQASCNVNALRLYPLLSKSVRV